MYLYRVLITKQRTIISGCSALTCPRSRGGSRRLLRPPWSRGRPRAAFAHDRLVERVWVSLNTCTGISRSSLDKPKSTGKCRVIEGFDLLGGCGKKQTKLKANTYVLPSISAPIPCSRLSFVGFNRQLKSLLKFSAVRRWSRVVEETSRYRRFELLEFKERLRSKLYAKQVVVIIKCTRHASHVECFSVCYRDGGGANRWVFVTIYVNKSHCLQRAYHHVQSDKNVPAAGSSPFRS